VKSPLHLFIEQLVEKELEEAMALSMGGGSLQSSGQVSGTGGSALGMDMTAAHKKLWSGDKPIKKSVKKESNLFKGPRDVEPAEDDMNAPKEYPAFGGDPNIIQGMMGVDSHYNYPPAHLNPELVNALAGDVKRRGRTVSDNLDEEAIPFTQAIKQKLALWVKKSKTTKLVLYNPATNSILAHIDIWNYEGCGHMITASVADHGYGPLMYDIAMSYVYPEAVIPDRSSVSPSARNVWKYYFENRKNELVIKKLPIDCGVPWKAEKDPYLNNSYTIKQPLDFSKLIDNHLKSKSDLGNIGKRATEKFIYATRHGNSTEETNENVLDQQGQTKAPSTRSPYGQTYLQKDDPQRKREMAILQKVKKNLDKKAYTLHDPPSMGISITNPKLKDRK